MRTFPAEFESKKEVLFYPAKQENVQGNILEIGPGRGDFFLSMARQCPDKKIVAIELDKGRYFRLIPRIEKSGVTNILLVQGDARAILPRFFAPGSFEKIYVLFPDPWPKRRHIPHRLMSIEFLEFLAERLCPDGELHSATDFEPYAQWVANNARRVDRLNNIGNPYFDDIAGMPYYNPTFYETKWREDGRAIFYLRYKKS